MTLIEAIDIAVETLELFLRYEHDAQPDLRRRLGLIKAAREAGRRRMTRLFEGPSVRSLPSGAKLPTAWQLAASIPPS